MPRKFGLLVILIIAIAGCSSDTSSFDIQTAIAETSQAQAVSTNTTIVRTATPTRTPFPTDIPTPTATLIPTETSVPTPTKVPLSDLDLESILFRSGDLSPSIAPGQISADFEMPRRFIEVTEEGRVISEPVPLGNPAYKVSLDLHYLDAQQSGSVKVIVYKTAEEAISLYEQLEKDVEDMVGYDADFTMAEQGVAGHDGTGTSVTNLLYGREEKGTMIQRTVFLRCNAVTSVSLIVDTIDDTAKKYAQRLDDRIVDLVCPNIPQEES